MMFHHPQARGKIVPFFIISVPRLKLLRHFNFLMAMLNNKRGKVEKGRGNQHYTRTWALLSLSDDKKNLLLLLAFCCYPLRLSEFLKKKKEENCCCCCCKFSLLVLQCPSSNVGKLFRIQCRPVDYYTLPKLEDLG